MERELNMVNEDKNKLNISYSRDYRHLDRNLTAYVLQIVLVLVPMVVAFLFLYNGLSHFMARYAADILERITGDVTGIREADFLPVFGGVYCVEMEGKTPSFIMSFLSVIVTLVLIIICSRIKSDKKPVMIFLTIALYIHLISSIYFVVADAAGFPYDLNEYSSFYMKQQIVAWLMIMVIYWLTTSLITRVAVLRISSFFILGCISFLFGFVRYILYLFIIAKASYLFMAVLYFSFGILFDFMIMVGVYSVFMKYASRKFKSMEVEGVWKWS